MRAAIARQNRRRLVAGGGIGLAALIVVAVVVAATGGGGEPSSAATNATATTEITRQDLVETDSADGTLGYSDSREVVNRLTGTVTGLPATGKIVQPNGVLYRVDGSPVILMNGKVPAYRTLSPSVSDGADVAQLEQDLRDLGYDSGGAMTVDDSWDSGTTAAVKRWQDAHGFSETGSIKLGRIVFQPGARRVSKVDTTLGSDGSSSGGTGGGNDSASTTLLPPSTQFASSSPTAIVAQATTPTTPTAPSDDAAKLKAAEEKAKREEARRKAAERKAARLEAEARKKAAEQQKTPSSGGDGGSPTSTTPAASDGGNGSDGGTGGGAASPIMTTTSTRPIVTVKLATDKATLAREGSAVTVTLPSGDTTTGRVTKVGKVATTETSSDGEESDPTIEVSVKLPARTKGLDQAPVSVDFEQSRRRDVLAIPVTALLARAGGKFAVEVRDGGARRLVPVQPGLYAGGFVEIEGRGLRSGMKVTDARI